MPQLSIINPSEFQPNNSIEVAIWVAVGGRGTLVGAALGAFLVNFGKTYLTRGLPSAWLFVLGALFIVVTLFSTKRHSRAVRSPKGFGAAKRKDVPPSVEAAVDANIPVER